MPSLVRWTLAVASAAFLSISAVAGYSVPRDAEAGTASLNRRATYTNPTLTGVNADPWVILIDSYYYLLVTTGSNIKVRKSSSVTDFNVPEFTVWSPTATNQKDIWAPELHQIGGKFYIYAAMDDGTNANHRMYVWQGTSTTDPTQPFNLVGKIGTSDDSWAIDGTVFQSPNGNNYFIWSGWPSTGSGQNLYIAKMSSPTALTGSRVLLHTPVASWQADINEGPEILIANGRVFLIYSANESWTENYCLAMMGLNSENDDPLTLSNWWTLDTKPVMSQSAANSVYGPGHASFTTAPDGTPVVVYHAMDAATDGWGGRSVRSQSFKWNTDGSPWLPTPPIGTGVAINDP